MQDNLTPKEFAEAAQVTRATVQGWIKKGKIKVVGNSLNNRLFIPASELSKLELHPKSYSK